MAGATGNIYFGLQDYEDMSFLLHVLRPEDLFLDVGANVGAYTILASAVVGATTYSFEPVPETFGKLVRNVEANQIRTRVVPMMIGLGESAGQLPFTSDCDTTNRVLAGQNHSGTTISVSIVSLDDLEFPRAPALAKLDVEGYEMSVLRGAESLLRSGFPKAVIVEISRAGRTYGIQDAEAAILLESVGFQPFGYDPVERAFEPLPSHRATGNTIYIRDISWATERVKAAASFVVLGRYL